MSKRSLAIAAAGVGGGTDPNFKNVSLLLSGDGTNGAQNNTFVDSSSNNFTITRNGNTTQGTFSPYGSNWSVNFSGTSSWLAVPQNAATSLGTGNFTIEAWIFTTSTSLQFIVEQSVIDEGNGNNTGWLFTVDNGQVCFGNATNHKAYIAGTPATSYLGKWTHVALVRTSTTLITLYVDGVSVGSTSTNVDMNMALGRADTPTLIGCHELQLAGYFFNGYISNLRIVKGNAVYTGNFTPSTTPLTAVSGTGLLTLQSNRLVDNSGNNLSVSNSFSTYSSTGTSVQKFGPFNPTAPYSASTIGGSGYFDGSGDYLSLASNSAFEFGTGDFTVEMWIYPSTISGTPHLYSTGTTNGCFTFATNNGNLTITCQFQFGAGTSNAPLKAGVWNHVAVTRSGSTVYLFVNGVVGLTRSGTSNNFVQSGLGIAAHPDGSNPYTGYISNLRSIKGTALYTSNFTPPTAPLTPITNTSLLLNFTNAGIPDAAMQNDLETVGNAQVSTSVKKYGTGSIYLDGNGDWLVCKNANSFSFGTGDFTIEAWVNFNTFVSTYPQLVSSNSSAAPQFAFTATTMYIYDAVVPTISGNYTWSTGVWYHVAWTRQNGTVRMFVNGTSVYSGTYTQNLSSVDFMVGAYAGGAANGIFAGYIDDLRITKGYARYTANFTPPTQALPTN